jgi:hypothetical protein
MTARERYISWSDGEGETHTLLVRVIPATRATLWQPGETLNVEPLDFYEQVGRECADNDLDSIYDAVMNDTAALVY